MTSKRHPQRLGSIPVGRMFGHLLASVLMYQLTGFGDFGMLSKEGNNLGN